MKIKPSSDKLNRELPIGVSGIEMIGESVSS